MIKRQRWLIILLIILLINRYISVCQGFGNVDKWKEYIEDMSENEEDLEKIESLYTDLSYLAQHPMDINTATIDMLKSLPFLSDQQIDSLMSYRNRYGNMLTLYELKNIDVFDWPTIELFIPFVFVEQAEKKQKPITWKNLLRYGSDDLILRYDRTLEQKQGYRSQPDSILEQYPNRKYLGEPFYHSIRYSYTFDNRILAGCIAEKDVGEPFWNKYYKGYDYYSAHVYLRDFGIVKSIAIGDYKASFGQGLVLSHDFIPGRSALITQVERRNNGFRRHYSTNEVDFFRGAASTIRIKKLDISFFYSLRKVDVTQEGDSITSFKTDGLHRTTGDFEKRYAASMKAIGGNIRYAAPNLVVGMTALRYDFGNLFVEPDPKPYNRYYFRGRQNINVSVDYLVRYKRIKLFGETAVSQNGACATLNALHWSPASFVNGIVLYRSYAKDYHSFYGNAYAQNSMVQNEQGLYIGLQLSPLAHWKISGYTDFFRFPWLKHGVDAPSSGIEYMAQVDYSKWKKASVYIRYRYRQKESNRILDIHPEARVLPYEQQRIRSQIAYTPFFSWAFRTSLDYIFYKEEKGSFSKGWMAAQSITWRNERNPLQADLYMAYFYTDDYNSRLISYEKNLLYVYNTPFLYDHGTRMTAVCRYFITRKLSVSVKFAWTHYFKKETIGSGLETIEGKNRTDLNAMLQWKF